MFILSVVDSNLKFDGLNDNFDLLPVTSNFLSGVAVLVVGLSRLQVIGNSFFRIDF